MAQLEVCIISVTGRVRSRSSGCEAKDHERVRREQRRQNRHNGGKTKHNVDTRMANKLITISIAGVAIHKLISLTSHEVIIHNLVTRMSYGNNKLNY